MIVDLSLGDPNIQALFSDRICRTIFADAMSRFTQAKPNNFIQFYFEEAHNLFMQKILHDADLYLQQDLAERGIDVSPDEAFAIQKLRFIHLMMEHTP